MRIAIDGDPIGRDGSGNETYLRGIIGAMARSDGPDELLLFGSRPEALAEVALGSAEVVVHPPGVAGDLALGLHMRKHNPDSVLAHYNLPLAVGRPTATIVHDVAFLRVAHTFPPALRWRLRTSVLRSVRRSAAIVTVSEFSRTELLDAYPGLDRSKVIVAPNAPKPLFYDAVSEERLQDVRRRYSLPQQFVLGVGNIQPRKNLSRLVAAGARVGLPVVLVGQVLHAPPDAVPQGAQWLGRVSDADLAVLYRLCHVFAYVSLYEGFGLPVVEALASGAVVMTSATTALAEVAADSAVLVDPASEDAIAEGLSQAAGQEDLRGRLRRAGPARASRYSWDKSGALVVELLRGIAA